MGQPVTSSFLCLPLEVRQIIYRHWLFGDTEMSLDEDKQVYYVLWASTLTPLEPKESRRPRPISINVPPDFAYPASINPWVTFKPPAGRGLLSITYPQIIPIANVDQPNHLSYFTTRAVSTEKGPGGSGIYVGPVVTSLFSYLLLHPPFPKPVISQILPVCKQVYNEAFPIFYEQNPFVLHCAWSLLPKHSGLKYVTDLRIKIAELAEVFTEADTNREWSTSLQRYPRLQRLTLYFSDKSDENYYAETVIRIAANFEGVTHEPKMIVAAIIRNVERPIKQLQKALQKDKQRHIEWPGQTTIKLIGVMSREQFGLVQGYNKNRWFFKRESENDSEVKADARIELEWVRSQE
jgi:hypothetical protein